MDIILIFVAGFIVFIIALFSVIKMVTNRVTAPTDNLRREITTLKKRIDGLENANNNK